jgi:hypothetical protein
VKQVGILFTDEMARAVAAGVKTETRRPIARAPKVKPGDELYPRVTYLPDEGGNPVYRFSYRNDLTIEEVSAIHGWIPSIHMPKVHAPFFMPIVEVVEENLHDITEEGAKAEGAIDMFRIDLAEDGARWIKGQGKTPPSTYVNGFRHMWDQLYEGTSNAWERNSRVVVYRWKKIRRPAR